MITIRRSSDRGHFDHGWLDTFHTFSFGDYQDRQHMGFRSLRVINEDRVQPSQGFGRHPHRDMEILTYVLSGELEHSDSLGNGAVIRPGEVQYMAAGTGIEHSEFNPSATQPVHLMQVWIRPDQRGMPPRYEQRRFPSVANSAELTLLASLDGRDESIQINQDALVFAATLQPGQENRHALKPGRGAWLQLVRGSVQLDGEQLEAGDGVAIEDTDAFVIQASAEAELLLFDLA